MVSKKERGDSDMCDMRGMLSFMRLWMLSSHPMNGQSLAGELEKRRGDKPNPGTIYPALKELANRGLIKGHAEGRTIVYELTVTGRSSLAKSMEYFERVFGEILREHGAGGRLIKV
jgi:PadR family transcriptional regulator PadR